MKYETNTNYTWKPEDKFEITGKDLELLYNGLSIVPAMVKEDTTHITLQQLLSLTDAYKAIQARFIALVESDQIKPAQPDQPAQ